MSLIARCLSLACALLLALAPAARAADPAETRLPTVVLLTQEWDSTGVNQPFSVWASVQSTPPVGPFFTGGTMTFRDGATVLAVVPVSQYGTAMIRIGLTGGGEHVLSADFSGDDHYQPGTGSATHRVTTTDPLSGVPRPPEPVPTDPAPAPEPVPGDPVPAPEPPAPAPPVVSKPEVRAGLREVSGFARSPRSIAFAQRIAAPGTIAWTLEARAGGARVLASATRRVEAGIAQVAMALDDAAAAHLRAHPRARIVLRTELTLDDGRVLRSARRLTPR